MPVHVPVRLGSTDFVQSYMQQKRLEPMVAYGPVKRVAASKNFKHGLLLFAQDPVNVGWCVADGLLLECL